MDAANAALGKLLGPLQAAAHSVRVDSLVIPGYVDAMAARLYRPAALERAEVGGKVPPLPVLLYFHGGGFVGGSLDDADVPARYLAEQVPAA
ncbi:MAG TPA: hypothetical protein VN028_03645, partial [Rhodocyclaceae bacterium]|nr:hypothetical protein [Rhodocyclaceae bacterium]